MDKFDEMVEALEENEDMVECQECFDLFPKADCMKFHMGYVCPNCGRGGMIYKSEGKPVQPKLSQFALTNDLFDQDFPEVSDYDPGSVKDWRKESTVGDALGDLLEDEYEAIEGYEIADERIQHAPIPEDEKDDILDTIDHIKKEEEEHIEELKDHCPECATEDDDIIEKTLADEDDEKDEDKDEEEDELDETLLEGTGAETKQAASQILQVMSKEGGDKDKKKWADTASKVIEVVPDDVADKLFDAVKDKFSEVKVSKEDKAKIVAASDGKLTDEQVKDADTLGKILNFIDVVEFHKSNPGLVKSLLMTIIGIVGVTYEIATPFCEIINIIIAFIPADVVVKIINILTLLSPPQAVIHIVNKLHKKNKEVRAIEEPETKAPELEEPAAEEPAGEASAVEEAKCSKHDAVTHSEDEKQQLHEEYELMFEQKLEEGPRKLFSKKMKSKAALKLDDIFFEGYIIRMTRAKSDGTRKEVRAHGTGKDTVYKSYSEAERKAKELAKIYSDNTIRFDIVPLKMDYNKFAEKVGIEVTDAVEQVLGLDARFAYGNSLASFSAGKLLKGERASTVITSLDLLKKQAGDTPSAEAPAPAEEPATETPATETPTTTDSSAPETPVDSEAPKADTSDSEKPKTSAEEPKATEEPKPAAEEPKETPKTDSEEPKTSTEEPNVDAEAPKSAPADSSTTPDTEEPKAEEPKPAPAPAADTEPAKPAEENADDSASRNSTYFGHNVTNKAVVNFRKLILLTGIKVYDAFGKEVAPDAKALRNITPETLLDYEVEVRGKRTSVAKWLSTAAKNKVIVEEFASDIIGRQALSNYADEDEPTVICAWCDDEVPQSECREEADLGWVCDHCAQAITSRGERLNFVEQVEDDDDEELMELFGQSK